MAGILGGFLAGAAKGSVDVAKSNIDAQNAADLAEVNANIAVERDARIRENARAANAAAASAAEAAVPLDAPDRSRGLIDAALRQGNTDVTGQYTNAANLDRQSEAAKETAKERNRATMTAEELKRQDMADRKELKIRELDDKSAAREEKKTEGKSASFSAQTSRFNSIRDTIGGPLGGKLDGATGQYMIPPDNAERYSLAVAIAHKMERLDSGALSPGELSQRALDVTDKFIGSKQANKAASAQASPGIFKATPDFGGKTQEQWVEEQAKKLIGQSRKDAESNASTGKPDGSASKMDRGAPPPEAAQRMIQALQAAKKDGKNAITLRDGSIWILGPDGQPQRAQ